MKKKICLMVMLAVVAVMGAVCVAEEHEQKSGGSVLYYSLFYDGKKGGKDYELDWDTFYEQMFNCAQNMEYDCIFVYESTSPKLPPYDMLSLLIQENGTSTFSLLMDNGYVLNMAFSSNPNLQLGSEKYNDFKDAFNGWNMILYGETYEW